MRSVDRWGFSVFAVRIFNAPAPVAQVKSIMEQVKRGARDALDAARR